MSSRAKDKIDSAARIQATPPALTLADVLALVQGRGSLATRQRQDISSALRTLQKVSGIPLSTIAADVHSVRRALESVAPARHELSPGRWANVRSLILKALDLAGAKRTPSRSLMPPSSAWQHLLAPLPYKPTQIALLPFARFCTRSGVEPEAVRQETFDAFERDRDLSARARPREAFLSAVREWNRCVASESGWPAFRATVVSRRGDLALPWAAFPASLRTDVEAMVVDSVNPDPTAVTAHRPIKPVSARAREALLRALASAAVRAGCDITRLRSIADVVALDTVKAALRELHSRNGKRKSVGLHQMAKLACTLARRWVKVSEEHQQGLEAIRRNLDPGRHGMTAKNRATLRFFEDERLVDRFLALPARLARRVPPSDPLKQVEAVRLQLAVAIELLTVAPVRAKNLASIRLGTNLMIDGAGHRRRGTLHFAKDEVKNGVELEFPLNAETIAIIDLYLRRARPVLERVHTDFLFPGEGADHKQAALLSQQIADLVEAEIGVRLTAHQFRHLAGFLYLKEHPGAHEIVRQLLGHTSIDTTLAFYAGMEAAAAIRHFDLHIADRRRQAKTGSAKSRSRRR